MVDHVQIPVTNIWATGGDVVEPEASKQLEGWAVESVPRQWWNWKWFQHDTNIAYLLQKGIPEWSSTQEYIAKKSFVQRSGNVYRARTTHVGQDPAAGANPNWDRAFNDYSLTLHNIGALTTRASSFIWYNASGAATVTDMSAFSAGLMKEANDGAWRTAIKAQPSASQLTWLSSLTPTPQAIPFFNTATSMATLPTSAFGRSWLNLTDRFAAYTQLQLANSATTPAAVNSVANQIVLRDASGNFSAGHITATLNGNAATATRLLNPRRINGVAFDGTADIDLPPIGSDFAGTVARLHINGAGTTGTDKTTQLALRNTSNTDWISLAVINDRTLQFVFRGQTDPIVQIGSEVVLHTGNQFSLGPTFDDARARLGVQRLQQDPAQTSLFSGDRSTYIWVQNTGATGAFSATNSSHLWRFDENGQLSHGTIPTARISGLANSASIPAAVNNVANQLVQRGSDGSVAVGTITCHGSMVAQGNIYSRSSGTGNAHIGFQKADASELALIWGTPSNSSLNFRTQGGVTGMTLLGQDLTVAQRLNAVTVNASGNVNATGNVNAGGAVVVGTAVLNTAGNITGPAYGGYGSLTNWVDSVYAKKTDVMTDAQIWAAVARAGATEIGTYVLAGDRTGGSGGLGTIRAGSQLQPYSTISFTAGALPAGGQYRCMGAFAGGGNQITLWQRIS